MFGVYVTIDDKNVLDAQKVFVSMALINILKTPLSQLPFAMSTTMQVMEDGRTDTSLPVITIHCINEKMEVEVFRRYKDGFIRSVPLCCRRSSH